MEKEKYYYEFSLAKEFISDVVPEWLKEQIQYKVAHELYELFKKEIIDENSILEDFYCIFRISSKDKNKVCKVQGFCQYLMEKNAICDLINIHFLTSKIDLDGFQESLKRHYDYFSLDDEVVVKNEHGNKKLKI